MRWTSLVDAASRGSDTRIFHLNRRLHLHSANEIFASCRRYSVRSTARILHSTSPGPLRVSIMAGPELFGAQRGDTV